ncbi:MAG: tetratricopeptide repeat protein [Flavobacteriales bacterium]|nr:tetratricopeptide repeat protein [Flavobacteriales bacterium]
MKKKPIRKQVATRKPIAEPTVNTTVQHALPKQMHTWFALLCAFLGLVLYVNTLGHDYVLDDEMVTFKNKIITKGVVAIPEILTTAYREGFWDRQESLYRPLSLVMFAIEWQLAPNNPLLGHLLNVLLYSLTGWFIYRLMHTWMNGQHVLIPLAAALMFMAHPLHTEVVANIKSRDEILALFFGVLSLQAFTSYGKTNQGSKLILGSLYYLLAVLAKESAITLFAVIPLALYFFTTPKKSQYAVSLVLLAIAVFAYLGLRISALGEISNFKEIALINNSIVAAKNNAEHFATSIVMVGMYIRLFLFPHPLSYDYSYNTIPIATPGDFRFLASLAVIISMLVYIGYHWKKKDPAAFGLLFFGLTISIVSNMIIIIEATLGERFAYLPSLGLCMAAPVLLSRVVKVRNVKVETFRDVFISGKAFTGIMIVILSLFSVKTISRNPDWKTSATLFKADKDNNPRSARTQFSYASNLITETILKLDENDPTREKLTLEALEYLNRSIKIMPNYFDAWVHLVFAYRILKDPEKAIWAYENGLKVKSRENFDFYFQGGVAYADVKQHEKAIEAYKLALQQEPNRADVWNNIGMSYLELGQLVEAKEALIQSIQYDSTAANPWYNLGNVYARSNDFNTAIAMYAKALQRDPKHAGAMNNTGNSYAAMQQYDKAITCYEQTLSFDPNNREAIMNMGVTYNILGNKTKADEYFKRLGAPHSQP